MKFLFVFFLMYSAIAGLSHIENKISSQVEKLQSSKVQLLKKIVNINSGSNNIQGVKEVGLILKKELADLGFATRWINLPKEMKRAGHLFATIGDSNKNRILLIGHLDTVFEKESSFQTFTEKDGYFYGPGINDMKGGLVSILSALEALKLTGQLDDMNISVAFMGDEEDAGVPFADSRKDLILEAKKSQYALGFEYGVETINKATIARRGYSDWEIKIEAKRGHSSKIFTKKFDKGAGITLSNILSRFYKELPEKYLTFNPGLMVAGSGYEFQAQTHKLKANGKNNVIAKKAIAKGDLRTISIKQREVAKKKMRKIIREESNDLIKAEIVFDDSYPPMGPKDANKQILNILNRVSLDLGYGEVKALDPGKRGAADTSFIGEYTACIDGLGLLGDGAHSEGERVKISEIPKITKRTALLIYRLGK